MYSILWLVHPLSVGLSPLGMARSCVGCVNGGD